MALRCLVTHGLAEAYGRRRGNFSFVFGVSADKPFVVCSLLSGVTRIKGKKLAQSCYIFFARNQKQ